MKKANKAIVFLLTVISAICLIAFTVSCSSGGESTADTSESVSESKESVSESKKESVSESKPESVSESESEEKITITLDDTYYSEYGEMFNLPEPVLTGASVSDVSWTVKDGDGKNVADAIFGSFYPKLGTYTLTCEVEGVSKTVSMVCRDTKGPEVEYYDYSPIVFEGDDVTVPVFTAKDINGIKDDSASLHIYSDEAKTEEVILGEGEKTFKAGPVSAYYFVYSVKDKCDNESVTEIITAVRKEFVDTDIEEGVLFDFDEPDYVSLIVSSTLSATETPDISISTDGVDAIVGGALTVRISMPE
ncbi:MAG: hypothetical protein MJ072_02425 [Clostridia bacterium]|nr:hypothetical protein [Clostridia bacterium]